MSNDAAGGDKRLSLRDLIILAVIALVLSLGLPLLEDFVTAGDKLLATLGSYVWLIACVATAWLTVVITNRLFRSASWLRVATAIVAGIFALVVAFGGSVMLSAKICGHWHSQCHLVE